ncbi:hypothetical protein BH24DEI2_BH24DEI2_02240 [soil metagenome]
MRTADSAVYRAKRRGKGGFDYHPPPKDGLSERFDVEYKLRDAVECGELELYYQPQVNVAQGKLIGLEALVRWHHPELGFLAPDRFISVAEHTGLIIPIGAWVLEAACRQQRLWQEAGYAPGRIAVNVSAVQFSHPDFLENVVQTLKDTHLDPGSLELEITEGALINNMAAANKTLYALRDLGITLAIDDFGTGYSSLAYLQTMPVNTLKIDRSFMPPVGSKTPLPKEETQLLRGIIGLAHGLEKRSSPRASKTKSTWSFCAKSIASTPRVTTSANRWPLEKSATCSKPSKRQCRALSRSLEAKPHSKV